MSVIRISRTHFMHVWSKMHEYDKNGMISKNFCGTLGALYGRGRYNFVCALDELNALSCLYHGSSWGGKQPDLSLIPDLQMPDYNDGEHELITHYIASLTPEAMLKALECIAYNIEIEEIPESKLTDSLGLAYNTLKEAITEIQGRIINDLPAYAYAQWEIQ